MPIARPTTLAEALAAMAELPGAQPLAGGTDLMVEVTHGRREVTDVVALRRIGELGGVEVDGDGISIGALATWSELEAELADDAPGLAMAARTVGSPQIRNAGTLGGNLGTASPAGDGLPWLVAMDAEVEVAGPGGGRRMPVRDFLTGPKRTALQLGELITRIVVPAVEGPQHVAKVGPRNAMAISVASLALVVDTGGRRVRVAMGSVGPTPVRPDAAERAVSDAIDWEAMRCDAEAVTAFGAACAAAVAPIDDHRGTADYRRHAVGVLASRTLTRCLFG